MAISNLVLTQQIYSEETNGEHAHYREPVPYMLLFLQLRRQPRGFNIPSCSFHLNEWQPGQPDNRKPFNVRLSQILKTCIVNN